MAIQKWDPVRDLVNLQEKMNEMFDDALGRSVDPEGGETMTTAGWRPPIDHCGSVLPTSTCLAIRLDS